MSTTRIWTRALGVAGVTGGVVLLSAAASQAAEGPLGGLTDGLLGGTSVTSEQVSGDASQAAGAAQGEAAAQAPVTLGGLELGLSTASSQSSGSSSTVTDGDGGSVAQQQEQSSSDATNLGVDLGSVTLDPAAVLGGAATGAASSTDGAQDASAAEGAATGAAGVQAPVAIEGLAVTGAHEQASAQESQRTVTTQDGASSTTGSSSQQASATSGGLVVDEVTADPAAAVSGLLSGTSATSDAGRTQDASAGSTLAGTLEAAAPVHVGGVSGGFDDARSSERATWREVTDEDGDVTGARTERADAGRTGGAFSTGALTAEPAAALAGALSGEATRLDGRDDVAHEATDARGLLDLAAPFRADGLSAEGWAERATAQRTERWTTTEDGTARTATWSQRADAVHPTFATGPVEGDVLGRAWGRLTQEAATTDR